MVWRLQNPIKADSRQTALYASQFQAAQFLLKPKASFVRKSPRHSHQAPEPCKTTCNYRKTLCFFYCVGRLLPRIIIICSCTSPLRPRAQGTRMPVYSPNHRAFSEFCEGGRLCPSIHRLRVCDILGVPWVGPNWSELSTRRLLKFIVCYGHELSARILERTVKRCDKLEAESPRSNR